MSPTSLLLMLLGTVAPAESRYPAAVELFCCDFEQSSDTNFDHWPDGWTRKRGFGYPLYVNIKIVEPAVGEESRSLRIDLDGGAAAIFSPPVEVGPLFSYVLEARFKTAGLVHDWAYLSITFQDEQRKPIETIYSERYRNVPDWKKIRIGPFSPQNDAARYVVVGLHVEPGTRQDLTGTVMLDELWLARVSRMTAVADRKDSVYVLPAQPEITCTVSGLEDDQPRVKFELLDVQRLVVASTELPLKGKRVVAEQKSSNDAASDEPDNIGVTPPKSSSTQTADKTSPPSMAESSAGPKDVFVGRVTWQPPIPDVGFYQVRVSLQGKSASIHQYLVPLAVVRPLDRGATGEFGWSLPHGEKPLSLGVLADLVTQSGINWLKLPLWYGSQDLPQMDQLSWFAERLHMQGVELVGLLQEPPPEVLEKLGVESGTSAARVFSTEPELWYPSLEPILTRLSLNVRWWQLGRDGDISFVGYPNLQQHLARVKKQMEQYGQHVELVVGWNWLEQTPGDSRAPWSCLSMSADPPLTAREQAAYLAGLPEDQRPWIILKPLASDTYSAEDRAADLVQRMMSAKIGGASGIFLHDPFNSQHGLMNEDGTAGELLLPWRTVACALSGSEHIGSVPLPGGSSNEVFVRGGKTVMVVWNERPTEELLALGGELQQMDLWGRNVSLHNRDGAAVVQVGRLPTLLTGVPEALARWHMSCALEQKQLPSIFGTPHTNRIKLTNFFRQGVSGTMKIVAPEVWQIEPQEIRFKLGAGETVSLPFQILLPFDASSGPQRLRVDFDLLADQRYHFSLHREVTVGLGDVTIDVASKLTADGRLEVTQQLKNVSDDLVSFKCQLYAPDRRRMLSQVLEHGRGTDVKVYRFENGQELIGKTLWLRAEEIGGPRTLNYRIVAEE